MTRFDESSNLHVEDVSDEMANVISSYDESMERLWEIAHDEDQEDKDRYDAAAVLLKELADGSVEMMRELVNSKDPKVAIKAARALIERS